MSRISLSSYVHVIICLCLLGFPKKIAAFGVEVAVVMVSVCCCCQAEWSVGVELVVGPDIGISYVTEKASSVRTALCTSSVRSTLLYLLGVLPCGFGAITKTC